MVEALRNFLPTIAGRIMLGLFFVGAVIVGIGPDPNRPIDMKLLVAAILAGLAWLWSELADVGKVSDHDRALFQQIIAVLDQNALSFLRQHDFSVNFNVAFTQPVFTIAEWHGPDFVFLDRAVQKRWMKLWRSIYDQSELYSDNLINTDNMEILTAWHTGISRREQPPQAYQEVKALNDGAHDVYRAFDKFVPFARRRLAL